MPPERLVVSVLAWLHHGLFTPTGKCRHALSGEEGGRKDTPADRLGNIYGDVCPGEEEMEMEFLE